MSGIMAALLGAGPSLPTLMGYTQAADTSASTTHSIGKPSGTASGELLVGCICADNTVTWTGDTGWSEDYDQGSSPSLRVAHKTAGGSEPASYTFTSSSNRVTSGLIVRLANAAFDAIGTIVTGSSTLSPGGITSAGGVLLALFCSDQNGIEFSTPSGMTLVAEDKDSNRPSWALFQQDVTAGSTGSRSTTPSGAGSHSGILFGVKAS